MSNVIRPSGPLPPRVYWTRRLLLLVVLVVVLSVLWWVLGRVTGGTPDSAASQEPPAPSSSVVLTTTPVGGDDQDPSGSGSGGAPGPGHTRHNGTSVETDHHPREGKQHQPELAEPTGECDPAAVDMEIAVSDSRAGRATPARLLLTSTATPACTLAVTATSLVLRVTSGDDIVWSSDDCPDMVLAKEMVVRAEPATAYRFTWNGRRSTEGCHGLGRLAEPGGYWVEAALIGGDPHRAYFDLT